MAPKTSRQAARNLHRYEVDAIPARRRDSAADVLLKRLLANRGKSFLLMEKGMSKKSSALGLVRRLRRRAEEVGIADIVLVTSRSSWVEGRVSVYGRALTEEEVAQKRSTNNGDEDERDGDGDRDEGGDEG